MGFILAHLNSQSIPPHIEKPLAADQDFEDGALLVVDASDNYAECGADPASVGAVSGSPAGPDASGFNKLGVSEFPPGYMQGIPVEGAKFHAEYVGDLPAAAGGSYGVVRDADGHWKVDFAETTTTVVKLLSLEWTESPLNKPRVLVEFLPGVVQSIN